jgi:hypothetical protein
MIKARGTDALAWYFPFHSKIAQHGIYISSRGALWLAERYFRRKYSDGELAFAYHEKMNLNWFAPRDSFDSLGLYPNASRIDSRRCPIILADEGHTFAKYGIVAKYFT